MVPSDETVKLTYRELADHLKISLSAARSRIRRGRVQGKWRVIPGNHPSTPALIEMSPEEFDRISAERAPPTLERTGSSPIMSEETYLATLSTLQNAYKHINTLNERLQTILNENVTLREKNAFTEAGRLHLSHQLAELEKRCRDQEDRLTIAQLDKLESAVEIGKLQATFEERERYIERLELGVKVLQSKLKVAKRTFWKKLLSPR